MEAVYAGVDLGGTSVKCAIAQSDGTIITQGSLPTDSHEGPEKVLKRIGEYVHGLIEKAGRQPAALGMGVPGLVDVPQGITRYLPNMTSHWKDIPAAEILEKHVACPVRLLNDVRTATIGELTYGRGKNTQTMVFIAIGTGIGGGVVIDGKLRLGPQGAAGELGHHTIDPNGPLCGCGNHGCLETLASGTALAAEGIRLMLMGLAPHLHEATQGDPGNVTAEILAQVAELDLPVKDAIQHAAAHIAIGISNVVTTIHPELIVIGGGVANMGDLLLDRIREDVHNRIGRLFPADDIRIEPSLLGSNAGVMGAVALAAFGVET